MDRLIRLSIARIAVWSWVAAPASSNMLPSTRDRNELFRWLRAKLTKWRLGRSYILWRVGKQHPQRISCIIAHLQQQRHVCDKVHRCSTRTKSVTYAQSQQSRSQMHRANKVSHRCTEPTKSVTDAQSQQSRSQMHRANKVRHRCTEPTCTAPSCWITKCRPTLSSSESFQSASVSGSCSSKGMQRATGLAALTFGRNP